MNSWVWFILFSRFYFSEQFAFISMPIEIYLAKSYEIFMGITRLKYLSNAIGITLISNLV